MSKVISSIRIDTIGTSLKVQWLRLHAPNAGGPGLIPGQGARSRMLQLKDPRSQIKKPKINKQTKNKNWYYWSTIFKSQLRYEIQKKKLRARIYANLYI